MAHRYFLVYFIFTSCTVAGQSPKYALRGLKVHLKGDITGQPDEILWKHKGNKVVQLSGNQEQVYSVFKNRITLNEHTAELDITDLRYEDSGEYVLEAYKSNELSTSTFQLEVIDKVVKPTISCEMNEGSSSDISGPQATLMCSAESRQPQLMKFEWSSDGNMHPGPNLTISLGEKHDDEEYSCTVSNPLSSETATFTAKDCYPGKSSSTALTVTLIMLAIILLAVILGIGFCKLRHKACFAKGNQKTVETPDRPEGSGNNTSRGDEEIPLLQGDPVADQHREPAEENVPRCDPSHSEKGNEPQPAGVSGDSSENTQSDLDSSTAPEPQGYVKNMKQRFEPKDSGQPSPQKPTANTPPNLNNLASSIKGDPVADEQREPAEENVPQCDPSHSERENEPDPAGVLGDSSQNTQSYLDSSTDPEPQGYVKNMKQRFEPKDSGQPTPQKPTEAESEADEEAKSPANDVSPPAAQSHLPLTQSSPNMAPKDNAGEHEEEANSDQVSGETLEETYREADTGKTKESDSTEEKHPSTVSEETTLHKQDSGVSQGETHTGEDNQQEPDKPVSEDENESDGVGDGEEKDDEEDRSRNVDTFQQSPGTAHADSNPEEDGQTRHDSRGQSDKSTADADKAGVMVIQTEMPKKGHIENIKQQLQHKVNEQLTPQKTTGTGETNESDDTEEKHPSTVSEENGPETTLHKQDPGVTQEETHTEEDNQQNPDKPDKEDKNESDDVGEGEEKDEEETSKLPQSASPTKPDQHREPAEENVPWCDPSHSEKGNEPQPAGVSDDSSGNIQSDLNSSTAPEPQGESNKSDDTEEKHPSTFSEENGPETTLHKQDSGVTQGASHTGEDNQQEPDKPDEEDKNESDDVGEGEEKDEEETSKLPQCASPTKPDNINTSADHDSCDSGIQSDKSTADAFKGYVKNMKQRFQQEQ